jgi:superfamily I DNA/RNA helicase/CRISPR/Cas system-associated exonuclease Cas4 (RecB family)
MTAMISASPLDPQSTVASPGPFEPDGDQARVLTHERGPLLVTGGPGTGKTALLRERFARLVESGTDPERVAFFVLGRRAARETREHLVRRVGRSLADLPVFTVHGFAFRVIGRRFRDLGYAEPPQVLSAPEQYAVVRQMLARENPGAWPEFGSLLAVGGFAQQVADFLLRAQERLLDRNALDAAVRRSDRPAYAEIARFYRRYLDECQARGRVDFAGLLLRTVDLLRKDLSRDESYHHVLVDDYQDATHATEAILQALSAAAESLTVAADPQGHVFSYRGGSREPLARVAERLGCRTNVELRRSYRLAGSLAPLEEPEGPDGEPAQGLEARLFAHPGEEADAVAHELLRHRVEEDVPWQEMAVIIRRYAGYLTSVRHALARHHIPFVVVAEAAAVATEPANRPILDFFRYALHEDPPESLLETVLCSPVAGLDPHDLRDLRRAARLRGLSLIQLVHEESEAIPDRLRQPVGRFRWLADELPRVAAERGPDGAFFWLWSELPHARRLVEEEGRGRDLDALAALGNVLSRFVERRHDATLQEYLDTLDAAEFGPDPWVPPEERHPHAVRILSAHRAHGTEFEVALVAGCLEGEFPSLSHAFPLLDLERLLEPRSGAQRLRERLAEERALFRLAVSRARRRTILYASHSTSARNPRTPSRFVKRLGLPWSPPQEFAPPAASQRAMEAGLRRVLADPDVPSPDRLAAMAALPRVGARPAEWWWGRDWTDPGAPIYPDEVHTSYTRLSTLENCPLQYLYAAELGLDTERSHYMWLGSVIHELVDRVQQGKLPRDEDAVLDALDEAWRPEAFPHRALERQRYRDARNMLRRWLRDAELWQMRLVKSEQAFEFPLDGAMIRGRIDAIFETEDGGIRVLDYKTGKTTPTREELKEHLQLAAYFLAMREVPELRELGKPSVLELDFLAIEAFGTFKRMPFRPPEGFDRWAEETLREYLQTIREERFAPSPEAECRNCAFKTVCPVWPQGGEVLG